MLVPYPNSSKGTESSQEGEIERQRLVLSMVDLQWENMLMVRYPLGFPVAELVKNLPAMPETWVRSLGWEDLLEKGKASHSSILAWRIPWTV